MNLENWGWNKYFSKQYKAWQKAKFIPARVIRGEKNYYKVWSEQGELTVRFAGKIRHKATGRVDLPVVGDWVVIEPQPGQRGLIHALLERRNSFSRNLPGRRKTKGRERTEQQVIAANIDLIFIVSGLDQDFNLRRIERYLTLVGSSGSEAVILLNKKDLCENPEMCRSQVEEIAGEAPVHLCMARNSDEITTLKSYLKPGQTIALLGSSGVGKSTIVNALLGIEKQKTAEVSSSDGKGRHTTTHRELFLLDDGGILMDNPGMRELHLWGDEEDLSESFTDIDELACQCKFSNCGHQSEPGCAVKQAIDKGDLSEQRLNSYLKLKEELANLNKY